jgi:hypothetical protein
VSEYPYKANILGTDGEVRGWTKDRDLILTNGYEYTFERLSFNPPGQPLDEPNVDIFGWLLLEVAKLRCEDGDWFLNDERLPLKKWMQLELQKLYTKRGMPAQYRTGGAQITAYLRAEPGELPPQYMTREILDLKLRHLPSAIQEQINGVAWFKHDDGADGWNTPILLKSFREIVSGTRLQVQPAEPLQRPEINDTYLWHVQQRILDKLDIKLRSAPSASQVFVCFCRDRLTLAEMHRRNQKWSESTIKLRIKSLRAFLKKEFNGLTLEDFFVDRSIFNAAEKQLKDYRAKNISPLSVGELHNEDGAE